MIPNHTDRHVQTSGVTESKEMGISLMHSAHIMRILRNQIYTDKVMAVLREYSANAWDANRETGRNDVPIKVTLPTVMDPTLYIRDFGPGISHADVFEIYAMYGESTKRNKNGQVGMLGIGSKSGFAYTDSFTVTTWQEGRQRIYAALLNNDEKGSFNLLDDIESDEPNGTMIQIPVRPLDIPDFVKKAERLFVHFKPRPDINTTLPPEPIPEVVMQNGTMTRGHGEWFAVMGCIAYEINLSQLRGLNAYQGGAGAFLDNLDGYLYFDIGEVEIAASREGLEYSDKTKAKLIDKFTEIVDEFVKHTLDKIEQGDFSFWEKRCRSQVLNDLKIPVPHVLKILTDESVTFEGHESFILTYGAKQVTTKYVHVNPKTRLVLRDEIRKIEGYGLTGFDYVVRPNKDKDLGKDPSLADVKAELDTFLEKLKIVGIPVINISSIPWHAKAKFNFSPIKTINKKHQVRTFVLDDSKRYYSNPFSDCWKIETITPTPDDVFVLLNKFKVIDDPTDKRPTIAFYGEFTRDRDVLKPLKFQMPKIFGYKSTEKEPVKLADISGISYSEWRVQFFKKMAASPEVAFVLDAIEWRLLVTRSHGDYSYKDTSKVDPKVLTKLFTKLGAEHPVCVLFRKIMIAKRNLKRVPKDIKKAVKQLMANISEANGNQDSGPEIAKKAVEKLYPMLELFEEGLTTIIDDGNEDHWIDYILLVDRAKKGLSNEGTISHSNGRGDHNRVEGESTRSEEGSAQLQQPEERVEEGEGGRQLGEDRGPPDGVGDGEGLVKRQVHHDLRVGDLLRAASA